MRMVTCLVVAACAQAAFANTATINGVKYNYSVENGNVIICEKAVGIPSISTSTSGALVIPSTLGGLPVIAISERAFSGCSALTSVEIPDGVTTIGDYAFSGCDSLVSISIPSSVKTIGAGAFENCTKITSVQIPDGVESIGGWAFRFCSSLIEVGIPKSVKTMPVNPFSFCDKLKSIEVSANNSSFCSVDGVLYTKNRSALLACPGAKSEVGILDSVTSIEAMSFEGCGEIRSIVVPDGVKTIGAIAFHQCVSLKSIMIPKSVTTIVQDPFLGCSSLETIAVEHGDLQRIDRMMSQAWSAGDSYIWCLIERKDDGGPYIETYDGVEYTFSISNCEATIGTGNNYAAIPIATSGAIVIPSTLGGCPVTTIGRSAFSNCSSLTSVTIPREVTTIGSDAFRLCTSLVSVTFPSGLREIGNVAFANCTSLTAVTVPESVTNIVASAFRDCSSLEVVRFLGSLPQIGSLAFGGTPWYERKIMGVVLNEDGSGAVSNTVVVTNVVVHYVMNSIRPEYVNPVSEDSGFVNVIAEVSGNNVAVPQTWATNYPGFASKFGSDFTKALTMKSGKIAAGGREMLVWEDYVAGTDPTNPNDKFTATMTMVGGKPVISWTPELDADRAAMRKYTTYGKAKLTDNEWFQVSEGNEGNYNFFKVTVEMK